MRGDDNLDGESATLELERLEQEITLVLQEIDKNLSKSNAVINDKIFPILKKYAASSSNVWNNVNFWKYFLEQAANVELTSYEAPANMNTDLNTIANSKNKFLLLDDEEEDGENVETVQTREGTEQAPQQFKKPLHKAFNNVEEQTPTWSTEEQNAPPHQYNMQASTPQLKQRASFIQTHNPNIGTKTSASESNRLQPTYSLAPTISSEEQSTLNEKFTLKITSPPVITHTIRQSLDNYHKISISPRKGQNTSQKTPKRGVGISDDIRRRSSLIQNLIDSSPTLPEPPVLLSERGYINSGSNTNGDISSKESSESKNLGKLSPILLPPGSTPGKQNKQIDSENTMQRFPRTPNFTPSGSREKGTGIDIMRTPLGVRIRYGENDSDLQPPELQNIPLTHQEEFGGGDKQHEKNDEDEDEDEVPLPDLETIQLPNSNRSKRSSSSAKLNDKKKPNILPGHDDEQNVFLDNSKHSNSQTLYHSIINNQELPQTQSKDNTNHSRENITNQSNSRSISYLFEEVLYNAKVPTTSSASQPQPNAQAKDLFGNLSTLDSQNDSAENEVSNQTGNSTSELGSLLGERFKNFTNYTQNID